MSLTQINKAGLDEIALDHVFTIGASGSSAYTFQGEGLNGTVNNPTLYLTRGKTYRFENGSGGHPIRIQSTSGASGTAYNTGVTNNAGSGTVIVEVQHDAPDVLYYQCTSHAAMNGILYITGALADGGVTTAKIADEAVTLAKLPHGTSSNDGKFLRANNGADPSFETVTSTTINNNADNRVITGSGTANTLNGESALTFSSNQLTVHQAKLKGNQLLFEPSGTAFIDHSTTGQDIQFRTSVSSSQDTTGPTIKSSGKVGIGTSSPQQPLHLHTASSSAANMVFSNTTTGSGASDGFVVGLDGAERGQIFNQENTDLLFGTNNLERLRIDSSGRLLLGTTSIGFSAGDNFTLADSGHCGITVRSGTSSEGNLFFSDGTSGDDQIRGYVQYNHSNNNLILATDSAERMRIDSSGRVGIQGTPNSSNFGAKLQVRESGQSATTITALFGANENASGTTGGISDNTAKACRIGIPHYDTDQKAATLLLGYTGSGENLLYLGGGTGVLNGATSVRIYADSSSTINNGGNQVARFDSDGLKFGSDTAAANALNDYEEGTFSPSFANVDNSVITVNHYNYTKIGRLVHINAKFTIGSNNDGSRFGFQLPFTQAGSRNNVFSAISNRSGTAKAPFAFVVSTDSNYAYGYMLKGFGDSETAYSTFAGNFIYVTGSYESN